MTAPAANIEAVVARLLSEGPRATPLVTLGGGRFVMGATVRPDEGPVREVTLGPFSVSLTPVSNAEYAQFLHATEHEAPRYWDDERFNAPAQPVVGVSWFDAVDYLEWLSELLGRRCRLPTEAEREFAARGGVPDILYPWGNAAWEGGPFALGAKGTDRPLLLGTTEPNGYGLYHMGENVHEWCSDWYSPLGYEGLPSANPTGVLDGQRRASRGGSWRHQVKVSRIASRSSLAPDRRYNDYGLRVYADAV